MNITWYDIAEGREGEIDLCGLFQSLSSGPRLWLPLAACQIHQVESPSTDPSLSLLLRYLNVDGEDGVGAGRVHIHEGGSDRTVLTPHLHNPAQVLHIVNLLW